MNRQSSNRLASAQHSLAAAALAGAAACGFGAWSAADRFWEAYLFAFLTVSGVSLGCLSLVMLHDLVGGRWGESTRGLLQAGAWPLVAAPLLAAPLAAGVVRLYPWSGAGASAADPLLAAKSIYLNVPFFLARAAVYLLVWAILAVLLARRARFGAHSRPLLSALGLVAYVLTVTFAAVDWMMSLEPHWFSSVYALIVIAGQASAAFALTIIALCGLRGEAAWRGAATRPVFQDLGNLLLAAITFWAYVGFSQFLIIWSGNVAEKAPWYLTRSQGGWQWLAALLALLHFALPFLALLFKQVKRTPVYLAAVATPVALMHVVDVYWLVLPARRATLAVHWLDAAALLTLAAVSGAVGIAHWRRAAPRITGHHHTPERSHELTVPEPGS